MPKLVIQIPEEAIVLIRIHRRKSNRRQKIQISNYRIHISPGGNLALQVGEKLYKSLAISQIIYYVRLGSAAIHAIDEVQQEGEKPRSFEPQSGL